MEKQLPQLIEIGEVGLFLMGVMASIILLCTLLIPTFSKVRVPGWVEVRGLSPEALFAHLYSAFSRSRYEVRAFEPGPRLSLHCDSVTYELELERAQELKGEQVVCVRLKSDAVDLSKTEALSILSSAGVGWLTLQIERSVKAHQPALTQRWAFSAGMDQASERPLKSLARYVVTMAPWR